MSTLSRSPTRPRLFIALLWGAMALRFYALGAQSFWNDEGNAARLAERSLPLIVKGAAMDIHPPGYYLLLHFWQSAAGSTEFALRAFSALCSLLTVAVVAALGRRLGGRRAAALAALLMGLHPLAVYYAQEARMYALLGLLAALTLWMGERLLEKEGHGTAIAMAATLILGLYTHYAYLFVIAAVNGAYLALLPQRAYRARFRLWMGVQAGAAIAFLPWLPHLARLATWKPPDLTGSGAFAHLWRALLVGITHPFPPARLLPIAGFLTVWGIAHGLRRHPFLTLSAILLLVGPPMLFLATGSYRAAYLKFLLVSLPALVALESAPAGSRSLAGRGLLFLLMGALLFPQMTALRHLYHDPAYRRSDYRGVAARIIAEGRPGDAIALNAPNQWEVFTYYYHGPLPVFPAPYHPDEREARAWLATLLDGHDRLFVLYWGEQEADPQQRLKRGLATTAYGAGEAWIGNLRLARYGIAPLYPWPTKPFSVTFGASIRLEGVTVPERTFHPDEIVPITLFWRATSRPSGRYKLFVHLLDGDGQLVAQYDGEPVEGFRPTDGWQPGESIVDRCGVALPSTLPAGDYRLRIGLYTLTGERLHLLSRAGEDDGLVIARLRIEP